ADWFIAGEVERRQIGEPALYEQKGAAVVAETGVTITVKSDRLDMTPDGRAVIYDYKTGTPPSVKQQSVFDKQLLLSAALVEQGAFEPLGSPAVAGASFIG